MRLGVGVAARTTRPATSTSTAASPTGRPRRGACTWATTSTSSPTASTATASIPAGSRCRAGEAVTLADYRKRYATYRTDVDLQDVHRQHPFIVVWDDHEMANDAWSRRRRTHAAKQGDWSVAPGAPPTTPTSNGCRFANRTAPASGCTGASASAAWSIWSCSTRAAARPAGAGRDATALADPGRSLLGAEQETWLFSSLRRVAGGGHRVAHPRPAGAVLAADAARHGACMNTRCVGRLSGGARRACSTCWSASKITDLAILTGDIHSSWALDVPRNPWTRIRPADGERVAGRRDRHAGHQLAAALRRAPRMRDGAARCCGRSRRT